MGKLSKALLALPVLAGGALVGGILRFKSESKTQSRTLLDKAEKGDTRIVTPDMLSGLPEPVQRYLLYTGVVGKPMPQTVRLRQRGRIRQGQDQPWLELEATQYYSTSPPGFVWSVKGATGGLPLVHGRDRYVNGEGQMLITLAGLSKIVNADGPEITQGSLMRYLNEMVWFPAAFLRENVTWTAVDDHSAKVTLTDQGHSVTATLFFDDEGRLVNFEALRFMEDNGRYKYRLWSTPMDTYGEFEGLKLPVAGSAMWHLSGGDFTYIELEILDVQYNQPTLYA